MEIQEKIREYESFVEEKLKSDLKELELLLIDRNTKYKEWVELKSVVDIIKEFKEKNRDMNVQLDLGSNISTFANIEDYERTYVDVGLGYLLEMDNDEAQKYSDIRMRLLKKEIDHLRKLVVNVKVHIKMVLLAISELYATIGKR